MDIKDLDTIKLQPGETLVLRPRRQISSVEAVHVQESLTAAKIRGVIVAHDFDMFIGVNITQPEPEAISDDEHLAMIEDAYQDGKIIQFRPAYGGAPVDEWVEAHKHTSPHHFNGTLYEYRMPPAKG